MSMEEVKEAVLKECERLCPNDGDTFKFDWGWMKNWGDWFGFYGVADNPIFVTRPPRYNEIGLFHNFPLAYRLLNLEATDLKAELAKHVEWNTRERELRERDKVLVNDLRSKISKLEAGMQVLVEELEDIIATNKSHDWPIHDPQGVMYDIGCMTDKLEAALKQWKGVENG